MTAVVASSSALRPGEYATESDAFAALPADGDKYVMQSFTGAWVICSRRKTRESARKFS